MRRDLGVEAALLRAELSRYWRSSRDEQPLEQRDRLAEAARRVDLRLPRLDDRPLEQPPAPDRRSERPPARERARAAPAGRVAAGLRAPRADPSRPGLHLRRPARPAAARLGDALDVSAPATQKLAAGRSGRRRSRLVGRAERKVVVAAEQRRLGISNTSCAGGVGAEENGWRS